MKSKDFTAFSKKYLTKTSLIPFNKKFFVYSQQQIIASNSPVYSCSMENYLTHVIASASLQNNKFNFCYIFNPVFATLIPETRYTTKLLRLMHMMIRRSLIIPNTFCSVLEKSDIFYIFIISLHSDVYIVRNIELKYCLH